MVNKAGKVPAKRELRAWGCGCVGGRRLQGKLARCEEGVATVLHLSLIHI